MHDAAVTERNVGPIVYNSTALGLHSTLTQTCGGQPVVAMLIGNTAPRNLLKTDRTIAVHELGLQDATQVSSRSSSKKAGAL